ncbi:MAG: M23 family metallopeptidase [Casimicrobium sp.]
MNTSRFNLPHLVCAAAVALAVFAPSALRAAPQLTPPQLTDADVVWDMRVLSLDDATAAIDAVPQLREHRGLILDRAGLHSVSPRMIVLLLETSGVLDDPSLRSNEALRNRIDALVAGISRMNHLGIAAAKTNAAARAVDTDFPGTLAVDMTAGVSAVAETFVPGVDRLQTLSALYVSRYGAPDRTKSAIVSPAAAPANFFRLPWTLGQYGWSFNGVHTTSGSCNPTPCLSPQSSIDFSLGWPGWGTNTSAARVLAANAGTVTVVSSCNLRITNANGWASNYYHLSDIIVANGATVYVGQPIANYADNLAQALCEGGSSTGPHVHFTLINAGAPVAIDQSEFSGWKVNGTASIRDYDSNCARMYFTRAGVTGCAYNGSAPTAWAMHTLPATMASNGTCAFDIDGNSIQDPATDGLLLARYLLGLRGDALIADAVGLGATRSTAQDIQNFIASKQYDLDIDGVQHPFTDAILVNRVMRGQTNAGLTQSATKGGNLLTSGEQIVAYAAGCR